MLHQDMPFQRVAFHLVALSHKQVIFQLLLWLHDLLNQRQRCAYRQPNNIVVRSLDALNQHRTSALYTVTACFVIAVTRPDIGEDELVRHCKL
jgi:hypothetical protein